MKKILLIAAMAFVSVAGFAQQKFAHVNFNELVTLMPEADEARRRLRELTVQMRDSERLRPVAGAVEKLLRERVDPALQRFERAQVAEGVKRADALEKTLGELRSVAKAVEELSRPLEERAAKVETFERTKDLAQRQAALETAAADILKERPIDTRKLEVWKRMEEEAARQARELTARMREPGLDEARRQMERAAERMDELKRELDIGADPKLDEAARSKALDALEKANEAKRAARANEAKNLARQAQAKLDEAMKSPNATDSASQGTSTTRRPLDRMCC